MYQAKKEEMNCILPFFKESTDTLVWSCLQGYMGGAWVDSLEKPQSVKVITGDFCFLAGEPNEELLQYVPEAYKNDYLLVVPEDARWERAIEECYKERAHKFMRYAIKKEDGIFDRDKLQSYVQMLPAQFHIQTIDEALYNEILAQDWCMDLCSHFDTYENYHKSGIGFVIMNGEDIVCGASSYTVYKDGIEIEIDTREGYRRQGLALACAAKLILTCLDRGLYPSWDAANKGSVALAEKLGYHFDKEYVTYAVKLAE